MLFRSWRMLLISILNYCRLRHTIGRNRRALVIFFNVSIRNGVLYGYIVDVINRASELVILAIGMTQVTAASGGQDISVKDQSCNHWLNIQLGNQKSIKCTT